MRSHLGDYGEYLIISCANFYIIIRFDQIFGGKNRIGKNFASKKTKFYYGGFRRKLCQIPPRAERKRKINTPLTDSK